jgi:ATP-dependent helicase HrpA
MKLAHQFPQALRQVLRILDLAWAAEQALDRNKSPVIAESVADARSELERLMGPRAICRIGVARLPDLARYLTALGWRLDRMAEDNAKDEANLSQIRVAEGLLAARIHGWPVADQIGAAESAVQGRRMLDEFRVSLFAQPVRASIPISMRRIERFLASLPG